MNLKKRLLYLLAPVMAAIFFHASAVDAATITPNTTVDDYTNNGNCTLREAITAANTDAVRDGCTAGSGSDIVVLAAQDYVLTLITAGENANASGDLDITTNVTLQGSDRDLTIIEGNVSWVDRIIDVISPGSLTATNLSITGGNAPLDGGGIASTGAINLTSVDIFSNYSLWDGGGIYLNTPGSLSAQYLNVYLNTSDAYGGGIRARNGATVTLNQSFIGLNDASAGGGAGGIDMSGGTLSLTNSTVADNIATVVGGISALSAATVTIDSSTIAGNSASSVGGFFSNAPGSATIQRTIIAGNIDLDTSAESNCSGGAYVSADYNLFGVLGCTLSGTTTHNITGANPNLSSFYDIASNGTLFIALNYGSPAIEAAGASCLSVDVADTSRPQRGTHGVSNLCDIGAFEYIIDETAPTVTASANVSGATTNNQPTLTINSNETGTISYLCTSGSWSSAITSITGGVQASVQLNTLANGAYSCRVQVTDVAENTGQSAVIAFTVGVPGPIISTTTQSGFYQKSYAFLFQYTSDKSGTFVIGGDCTLHPSYSLAYASSMTIMIIPSQFQGSHTCTVAVRDSNSTLSNVLSVQFTIDDGIPGLTLNGSSRYYVTLGQKYVEPGATATDAIDTGIQSRVVITTQFMETGKVQFGGFVKYQVTDAAGNTGPTIYRYIIVVPTITTISLTNGTYTITNGSSKHTIRPFSGYSGGVFSRRIDYGKDAFNKNMVRYLFITTGATTSGRIKIYNQDGKEITYLNTKGQKMTALTLPSALTKSGVNVALAYNETIEMVRPLVLALGAKSGTDVPAIYAISMNAIAQRPAAPSTALISGNVLVRFVKTGNTEQQLITTVAGNNKSWKIWKRVPGSETWSQKTISNTAPYTVANGAIKYLPPTIKYYYVDARTNGKTTIHWVTNIVATGQVRYGSSNAYVYSNSASHVGTGTSHSVEIPTTFGQTYHFQITTCRPGVSSAAGCSKGPDVTLVAY